MIAVALFFLVVFILAAIGAHIEVRGLRGGYGKGVWGENSTFLGEAKDARRDFTVIALFILVSIIIVWGEP